MKTFNKTIVMVLSSLLMLMGCKNNTSSSTAISNSTESSAFSMTSESSSTVSSSFDWHQVEWRVPSYVLVGRDYNVDNFYRINTTGIIIRRRASSSETILPEYTLEVLTPDLVTVNGHIFCPTKEGLLKVRIVFAEYSVSGLMVLQAYNEPPIEDYED